MRLCHLVGIYRTASRLAVVAGIVCLSVVVWYQKPIPTVRQMVHTASSTQRDPRQQCQAMFTIDKGHQRTIWTSDGPYNEVSHQLPPLLAESKIVIDADSGSGHAAIYPGTRLQLMNGSIPYLPCQIRQYNAPEVGRCTAARAAKGGRTWIAFLGDSNQRQKTHSFLNFLPPELNYTYFLGNKKVTLEDFTQAVAHHQHRPPTFDIIGYRPPRRTTSSHPHKTSDHFHSDINYNDNPTSDKADDSGGYSKHEDFNSDKTNSSYNKHSRYANNEVFPETREATGKVLNGTNTLNQLDGSSEPSPEEDVSLDSSELRVTLVWAPAGSRRNIMTSSDLQQKVTKLKEWTMAEVIPDVIIIGLGTWLLLLRQYQDELAPFTELDTLVHPLVKPLTLLAARTHLLVWSQSRYRWFNFEGEIAPGQTINYKNFWQDTLYLNQFHDAIPFLDAWLWRLLRPTGAWHWDSTLPFNLANIQECLMLKNAGLIHDPIYKDNWWNCGDVHHSSYETNSVEIQMLLNLVCNPYLATAQQYCCSGR